jgi:hypothetical protein
LLRRVVWQKFTNVSEVLAASIIRANSSTTQKTAFVILAAVRTLNLTPSELEYIKNEGWENHRTYEFCGGKP